MSAGEGNILTFFYFDFFFSEKHLCTLKSNLSPSSASSPSPPPPPQLLCIFAADKEGPYYKASHST